MSTNNEVKCILRNIKKDLSEALPNIELTTSEKKIVGRSVETRIENPNVSRSQLMLKANLEEKYLLVKFIGKSPSAINGFVLKPDEVYEARQGDMIEVLYNTIFYEVSFQTERPKRKSQEMDDTTNNPEKKVKIPEVLSVVPASESSWEVFDGRKLFVYTAAGVKSSSKIAAYDLDNTLIKTLSKKVFAQNINDWQLNYSVIPKKLQDLFKDGYKIVIITNQAGISIGKVSMDDFKKKIQAIIARLNVPVQAYVAPEKGIYRKPLIGSWTVLSEQKNDGIPIDLSASFFVGDAAGRDENKIMKRKKDHSSADRLLALNLGIEFYTPEEHFLKEKKSRWNPPEFDPRKLSPDLNLLEPKTAQIRSSNVEVILMIGSPASGKSFFVREHIQTEVYDIISRDQLKTWQKCVKEMENSLNSKKSCVIDNTNPDAASRKKFIDVAKKFNVPIRAFIMNTTFHHAKHNNVFRKLTDPDHEPIEDMVLNAYKSKFEEPKLDEGFSEIVRVNLIPKFKDSNHKKLYNLFLLEK